MDTHEKKVKVTKADNTKWDNDWDKINKQREEIRAIKEKQRLAKLEAEANGGVSTPIKDKDKIEKSHNKWKDTHAKNAKVIKADNSKWDNDWDKIEKQRAEIKAIKEKKRLAKLDQQNELKKRNSMKTTTKYANKSHEKKPKKIAADNSKWDNDWDKINKKREEIKAIKEKKRLAKLEQQNELKKRNSMKTTSKYANNSHEKTPKKIAAKERVGNDWNKIEKQRAEIKALKEKKRREKAEKQALEEEAASVRGRARSLSKSKKKKKGASTPTEKKPAVNYLYTNLNMK